MLYCNVQSGRDSLGRDKKGADIQAHPVQAIPSIPSRMAWTIGAFPLVACVISASLYFPYSTFPSLLSPSVDERAVLSRIGPFLSSIEAGKEGRVDWGGVIHRIWRWTESGDRRGDGAGVVCGVIWGKWCVRVMLLYPAFIVNGWGKWVRRRRRRRRRGKRSIVFFCPFR